MNHTIESSKLFPIIAWTTVVGFALFTYNLTTNLNSAFSELDHNTTALESQLHTAQ
jgi:hypothetical protein